MSQYQLIPADDEQSWMDALARCGRFDVYHLPRYHRLCENMNEGQPLLFVWQSGEFFAALPVLVRPVAEVKGLEGYKFCDATSAYGYSGPLTNVVGSDPSAEEFRSKFQKNLTQALRQLDVVSLLVRSHPLMTHLWLFDGIADVSTIGPVVVMDLTLTHQEQEQQMSNRVLRDLRNARRNGVQVAEISYTDGIDEFIPVYYETMRRNNAQAYYFFSQDYFLELKKSLGKSVKLYVARMQGQLITSAIFFAQNDVIHYHLSGTPTYKMKYGGLKMILDHVRGWGSDNGFRWLNLGGGVQSNRDSLFEFKSGFSKQLFDFQLATLVCNADAYRELVEAHTKYEMHHQLRPMSEHFFPKYRRPSVSDSIGNG